MENRNQSGEQTGSKTQRYEVVKGNEEDRSLSKTLYIGNVPYYHTGSSLEELFKKFGDVRVYAPIDKSTGKNKGFSFITFKTRLIAENAKKEIESTLFEGRQFRCDWDIGAEKKGHFTNKTDRVVDSNRARSRSPISSRRQSPRRMRSPEPRGRSPLRRRSRSPYNGRSRSPYRSPGPVLMRSPRREMYHDPYYQGPIPPHMFQYMRPRSPGGYPMMHPYPEPPRYYDPRERELKPSSFSYQERIRSPPRHYEDPRYDERFDEKRYDEKRFDEKRFDEKRFDDRYDDRYLRDYGPRSKN